MEKDRLMTTGKSTIQRKLNRIEKKHNNNNNFFKNRIKEIHRIIGGWREGEEKEV